MKYVIKERISSPSYCLIENSFGFVFTGDLHNAAQFSSVGSAVDAIVKRALTKGQRDSAKFTIIGIKEVSIPRYEEVLL